MSGRPKASMLIAFVQGTDPSSAESMPIEELTRCRYIKTAMTKVYTDDPEYTSYIIGRTPAARWGLPEDFRGAIIFLASKASDFVCGTSIVVDGGMIAK